MHIDPKRLEQRMRHDLRPALHHGVLRISAVFSPASATRRQIFLASHRKRPTLCSVVVSNDHQLREDVLSLSDHISDQGVGGGIPTQELPTRVSTSMPAELEAEYAGLRQHILSDIKPLLDKNEAFTGFCTDPEAVLDFTVDKKHHARLFTRQYPSRTRG